MVDKAFHELGAFDGLFDEAQETTPARQAAPRTRDARQHYSTRYTRRRRSASGIHRRGKKRFA